MAPYLTPPLWRGFFRRFTGCRFQRASGAPLCAFPSQRPYRWAILTYRNKLGLPSWVLSQEVNSYSQIQVCGHAAGSL